MNWKLPLLTKRDIQQVYSWTRFVCLLVMINCTESVTVSIGIFVIFVLIAVLSGKLHWNHLLVLMNNLTVDGKRSPFSSPLTSGT